MRYRITRIAPMQAGKITAAYMFAFALVGVLIIAGFLFLASSLHAFILKGEPTAFPPLFLIGLIPALYGLLGFIIGIVGSLIYNLISKYLGGLELELTAQNKDTPP